MKKTLLVVFFALFASIPASAHTNTPKLAAEAFPAPMPQYLRTIIEEAAAKYDLDPNLLAAMAFKESAFNPTAVSRRGAQGILQLMPRTAKALGVQNAFDPRQNIFGGAKYVRQLMDRFDGNVELVLASYNLGPERIEKEGPRTTPGVVKYVGDITAYYKFALRNA